MAELMAYVIHGHGWLAKLLTGLQKPADNLMASWCAGPFTVYNEVNEAATLRRWFEHMRAVQPGVYVTYNGDFFDWPFLETRAAKCSLDMHALIGFKVNHNTNECLSRCFTLATSFALASLIGVVQHA